MDFFEIAKKPELTVSSLKIKNKGSVAKFSEYYVNLYNDLLEKFGLRCKETKYYHFEKSADGQMAVQFKWLAYKPLDDFARIRFNYSNNAYFIKGDNIAGIFSLSYTLELDYKGVWRNHWLLKRFLPYYLKYHYQDRILQWWGYYQEELNKIKDVVRKNLNISMF